MNTTSKKEEHIYFNKQTFTGQIKGLLTDHYDIIKTLGEGSFGKVFEIKHKNTGEIRASKQILKSVFKKNLKQFVREMNILMKIDGPHVVKLYEIYEEERFIHIVMEECEGGQLSDRIIKIISKGKFYTEREVAKLFQQIMSAIAYCHDNGIAHRDLKPENILYINKGECINESIKVIDFGLSRIFHDKKMNTKVGTPYYVAPEVLLKKYNEKCDIWSAAVILYMILSGEIPFNGENDKEIYNAISNYEYNFNSPHWKQISPSVIDLIKKCLVPEMIRPSAKEVLDHPWFKNAELLNVNFEINIKVFMNYINSIKLKQMILTYVASRLNPKEEAKLKEIFISYDKNKDGNISLEELKLGLKQLNSKTLDENDIEKIYKSLDTDKNGKIFYTEFLAALVGETKYLTEEKLYRAFSFLDKDHSGKIDKAAIKDVILHNKYIDDELDNIIEDADKNKDGVIDYNEFLDMMGFRREEYK